ncbi:MAG: glycoside hydrolase family 31 protein, partial [Lutibacter sp.]|nr:glycoside hydrolase family 31 protein [Lutibacter sp.]
RPLFFEDDNKSSFINDKTYLWGDSFLVSPVVQSGLKEQLVYFPENSNWYHFYTDEKVGGGQSKMVPLNEESIPVYVRGGAFIPRIQPIQNISLYSLKSFDLHFYFDEKVKESEEYLYDDDGETPNAFEKGMYEILNFESEYKNNQLVIEIESKIGKNYQFSEKMINLLIHNISKKPIKVTGNIFTWDEKNHTLSIPVLLKNPSTKNIKIKLNH